MFKEGDLVVILGSLNIKNYKSTNELIIGTYLGPVSESRVQVLLPDGYIFTGPVYEIANVNSQVKK